MTSRIGVLMALGVLVVACKGPRSVGHFGDGAFHHVRDHYRIRYLPESHRLMPPEWRIVNYHVDDAGRPTVAREGSMFWTGYDVEPRRGSTRTVRAEIVDLQYERRGGGARIWARTVPTSEEWADAPLDVILRDAVRGMATGQTPGLDLIGRSAPSGQRVDSEVVREGAAVVDGLPARWVTFDLTASESGSVERHTVVLLRPAANRWRYRRWSFPMLVMFGYASAAEQHEAHRPAFESLVRRVDVPRD